MRGLVLAFETWSDLPKPWKQFRTIDVYGTPKFRIEARNKGFAKVTLRGAFLDITKYKKPSYTYSYAFIRHPDPFGEPRNWMQAIAAVAESLSGKLECEFWFPAEILAFDFLLRAMIGQRHVARLDVQRARPVRKWKNYRAVWAINPLGAQKGMAQRYQSRKHRVLSA